MARKYSRHALQLLPFFAFHRVALATDVRRQFSDLFGTDRTTRLHLQTLVEHGDLESLQRKVTGRQNVYTITPQGCSRADTELANGKADKRRLIGNQLVHELLITEFASRLSQRLAERDDMDIVWQDRLGLASQPAFRNVVPDFAFMVQHERGLLVNLVEMSVGEESSARVKQKFAKYAGWMHDRKTRDFLFELYRAHGAKTPRVSFRLLLVVQDRRRAHDGVLLRQFMRQLGQVGADLAEKVWGTTLKQIQDDENPIDGPIWCRDPSHGSARASSSQLHWLFPTRA